MKKILVLNFSPRKKGNSAGLAGVMKAEIEAKGGEAIVYNIGDIEVKGCKACGACKKKDVPFCAQKDDFTAMLPLIDECDGAVIAAPIYFGRIPGTAKNFIDRFYCFFNPAKSQPLFTVKDKKKLALVMPCGGGDPVGYQSEAAWVGTCAKTAGFTEYKAIIENGLNELWNEDEPRRGAFAAEAKALAAWLFE